MTHAAEKLKETGPEIRARPLQYISTSQLELDSYLQLTQAVRLRVRGWRNRLPYTVGCDLSGAHNPGIPYMEFSCRCHSTTGGIASLTLLPFGLWAPGFMYLHFSLVPTLCVLRNASE